MFLHRLVEKAIDPRTPANSFPMITTHSNAKLNLALDIIGREEGALPDKGGVQVLTGNATRVTVKPPPHPGARSDRLQQTFHLVQTILCELTPENCNNFRPDELEFELKPNQKTPLILKIEGPHAKKTPSGKTNLIVQAVELLKTHAKTKTRRKLPSIKITLVKNIPVASGLGGGASNAATTLKALNHLWELGLHKRDLVALAKELGTDVPFFVSGGLALGEHYGEKLTQLPPVHGLAFHLFPKSAARASTASPKTQSAYAKIKLDLCGKNTAKTHALIHAIKTNDLFEIHKNLHNDFETTLTRTSTKGRVLPKNHHLAGAGPTQYIMS